MALSETIFHYRLDTVWKGVLEISYYNPYIVFLVKFLHKMQKLTLLSILIISGILGTTLVWSQLAFVQATSNESGTIQCITTPCDFPPSQATSNESGTIQCITTPCDYPSHQPLSMPPKSNSNNDTVTVPKNGIELPTEGQSSSNQIEPCLSPCPPGAE
ncbi:MAG: hypothetical protein ACRD6Q_07215, partial [Nitrososphaeraceae archaeon]